MRQAAIPRYWWLGGVSIGASLAVATGVVWNPLATVGVVAGVFTVGHGLLFASRLQRLWLISLGFLLAGYAFLDRGFAYVGVPPLFVGEMVLAMGLLAALMGGGVRPALRSPLSWLLIVFGVDGAVRTVPYLDTYGLDAMRDGAVWGYGAFALLVAAFLLRTGWTRTVPDRYGRLLPWFLLWMPVAAVIQLLPQDIGPRLPGSDVALLNFKPGDIAVHLAGVAAFLLLGLHEYTTRKPWKAMSWLREWLWWTAWLLAAFLAVLNNRGGLLAILTAVLVVLLLRPLSKWWKVALICLAATTALLVFNIEIDLNVGSGPTIAPEQILVNLQSIARGDVDERDLGATREWRLSWWNEIVHYTIFGKYFWTGKGFGINLADDDGFQGDADSVLRSPHNGHLTILARAGVPGLVLWILLQGAFGLGIIRAYFRARRAREEWWARVDLWILAYWFAFMVRMAFDVFLEGPQGGIWFWSLFGFGIAALEAQRRRTFETATRGAARRARL